VTLTLNLPLTKEGLFSTIDHIFWKEGLGVIVCARDVSIEEIEQLEMQSLSHFAGGKTRVNWGDT